MGKKKNKKPAAEKEAKPPKVEEIKAEPEANPLEEPVSAVPAPEPLTPAVALGVATSDVAPAPMAAPASFELPPGVKLPEGLDIEKLMAEAQAGTLSAKSVSQVQSALRDIPVEEKKKMMDAIPEGNREGAIISITFISFIS